MNKTSAKKRCNEVIKALIPNRGVAKARLPKLNGIESLCPLPRPKLTPF